METDIYDVTTYCANCNFPNILRQWKTNNRFTYYCHFCGAHNNCEYKLDFNTGEGYWTSTHVSSPMGPQPTTSSVQQPVPSESAGDDLRADPEGTSLSFWSEARYGPTSEMHIGCGQGYDNGYRSGYHSGYNVGYSVGRNSKCDEGYDDGYNAGLEFAIGHLTIAQNAIKLQLDANRE